MTVGQSIQIPLATGGGQFTGSPTDPLQEVLLRLDLIAGLLKQQATRTDADANFNPALYVGGYSNTPLDFSGNAAAVFKVVGSNSSRVAMIFSNTGATTLIVAPTQSLVTGQVGFNIPLNDYRIFTWDEYKTLVNGEWWVYAPGLSNCFAMEIFALPPKVASCA